MNPAETKECIGNIDPKKLITESLRFNQRKLELTEESYNKATLNNDYERLNWAHNDRVWRWGIRNGLTTALRYLLAQEAEVSGRKVSADMTEFDSVIEEIINGNL